MRGSMTNRHRVQSFVMLQLAIVFTEDDITKITKTLCAFNFDSPPIHLREQHHGQITLKTTKLHGLDEDSSETRLCIRKLILFQKDK